MFDPVGGAQAACAGGVAARLARRIPSAPIALATRFERQTTCGGKHDHAIGPPTTCPPTPIRAGPQSMRRRRTVAVLGTFSMTTEAAPEEFEMSVVFQPAFHTRNM
jgi:hypothetical protein